MFAEIGLEFGIQPHNGLVVEDEIVLDLRTAGQLHISIVQRVPVRSHRPIGCAESVLSLDGFQCICRRKLRPKSRRWMCPVFLPGLPFLAKAFLVAVAVLAFAGIKPPSKKHFPPDRLCLNYRTVRTVPFVSWLSGPIMISKSPGSHTHSRAWL